MLLAIIPIEHLTNGTHLRQYCNCAQDTVHAMSRSTMRHIKNVRIIQCDGNSCTALLQVGYVVMNQSDGAREAGMDQLLRIQGADAASVYYGMLDVSLVGSLHSSGQLVFAWTVNGADAMQQALDVGLDGIVTNEPVLVSEAIERRLMQCDRGEL